MNVMNLKYPRNLIICFDGTNNEFGREPTNVIRLIDVIDRAPEANQRLYYDPGVGTLPEPGVIMPLLTKITELFGLAFGLGLSRKVAQAYTYLMDFWERGDQVFILGFSRGAYTARVLAGLLHQLGLLPKGNYNLIPYALKYFRKITEGHHHQSQAIDTSDWKNLCDKFRRTLAREITPGDVERRFPVHFLGVWDTVSSVGWVWDPKHFPFTAYNPSVQIVRHCVSIDERRAFFRQNLFRSAQGQNILELWFPGVHSDIGGGFAPECGALWWNSFDWMQRDAEKFGLRFDREKLELFRKTVPAKPWAQPINASFKPWFWHLCEIWPKLTYCAKLKMRYPRWNLWRRRQIHSGALIHKAALERIRDSALHCAPKNLPLAFISSVRERPDLRDYLDVPAQET